ncbi:hypothetical protein MLPF_0960 [Mycobacterium lepromatosis]|nr:hypothetical protein MLPF_0960 [Mycobacterium lepromatosis]
MTVYAIAPLKFTDRQSPEYRKITKYLVVLYAQGLG